MKVIERADATGSLGDYAAEIDKGAVIVTKATWRPAKSTSLHSIVLEFLIPGTPPILPRILAKAEIAERMCTESAKMP